MQAGNLDGVGCVVIGRNEGERLRLCLESLLRSASHVSYVDSGSTDDSIALARSLGVHVIELDLSIPFTAARARNAGYQSLMREVPSLEFIQFIDGDCEVVAGWLDRAVARLREQPDLAVVCGRRRERFPDASIYNRLCDVEWDTPVGNAKSCGGDAMMRLSSLVGVGGFDPTLIAGEEPELCVRLRANGGRVERIDAEMTLHDAGMTRFGQWWRRTQRSGHAYAEGAALHGATKDRHNVRQCRRAVFWGGLLPIVACGLAPPTLGASLFLFAGYPLSAARAYRFVRRRGRSPADALAASVFMTVGKFPELQGMLKYHWGRLRGRRSAIIEYKTTPGGRPTGRSPDAKGSG